MFKKNGDNKFTFDPAGALNSLIQVIVLCGMLFMFYITHIDARMDTMSNDIVQIKTTLGID